MPYNNHFPGYNYPYILRPQHGYPSYGLSYSQPYGQQPYRQPYGQQYRQPYGAPSYSTSNVFSTVKTTDKDDNSTGDVYAINNYDCLNLKSANSKLVLKGDQATKTISIDISPQVAVSTATTLNHQNKHLLYSEAAITAGVLDTDDALDGQHLTIVNKNAASLVFSDTASNVSGANGQNGIPSGQARTFVYYKNASGEKLWYPTSSLGN